MHLIMLFYFLSFFSDIGEEKNEVDLSVVDSDDEDELDLLF